MICVWWSRNNGWCGKNRSDISIQVRSARRNVRNEWSKVNLVFKSPVVSFCIGILSIAALIVGVWTYRSLQLYWELHFVQISESQVTIDVVLGDERYGRFLFDGTMERERAIVVVRSDDVSVPLGQVRFADLTWPPGRVIIEVGDEVLDLMSKGVERRSGEWKNPPYY